MIAHLGMYPFAHLHPAYDELWAALAARLPDAPAALDREVGLHDSWRRADLYLGQTCGWPLVESLDDAVAVVGAFDLAVPFARDGRYRSVIIARSPHGLDHWRAQAGTVCAMNSPDSLSGWISLCWAWGGTPTNVHTTGAHRESVRAVAAGEAAVASIDGASFEFLAQAEPYLAAQVHVVAHGPLVPTLPLITAPGDDARVAALRSAIAAVIADPATAAARSAVRIRGFVPFGFADYEPLRALRPAS